MSVSNRFSVRNWARSHSSNGRPSDRDLAAGTVAVEFVFASDCLRIVNGPDENRIEVGAAHPDYVRHRLDR